MNICIPITKDLGMKSPVSEHFGSAPLFLIVDTDGDTCRAIQNRNEHHAHGMCTPLQALQGEKLDAIVVGGIGQGALSKLMAAGLQVFAAGYSTVEETVAAYQAGTLRLMKPGMACANHGSGHGTATR
jgi:predicted Fe-Mo cluster-binding NifX family protein